MPDLKITGLTADASPTSDDLIPTVTDPAGTPANRKVTLANAITKAHGLSDGIVKVATGTMAAATAGTDYVAPGGALGTPSSGVATNLTGTAAGLTAGTVTTNANLTGPVTSVGNATAIADAALSIAKTSGLQTALDAKAPKDSPVFTTAVTLPVALTGVIRADSGVVSVDSDVTDIVAAASTTAAGKVELATSAETITGTDTDRAVTPAAAAAAYQPLDADLTTIAGLTATTDNFIQSKASAWASRTPTQVTADLIAMVGDSGAGGTKGLVPAPAAGDASKFLKGDATWASIPGGGDALVANPLSQFAATTSLQLKGVISDETGSGALVFADTPTLVTPVLGAATGTSLQLSGLTASEIVLTDASKNLVSGAVATYPSLTELTYVKGVTSALQTQLNAKAPLASPTFTGTVTVPVGLTGVLRADTGVVSVDSDVTDIVAAASTTAAGKVELATDAETITGTDTALATTPANIAAAIANTKIANLSFMIDGGGSAITTGIKGDLEIPFACTINRVTLLADQSGSIVVDIWKDTYANYPATVADTITASAKPTISSATKSQDATLTGWTTSVTAGDILRFNVDSISTCTRVLVSLKVTKS